MKVIIENPSVGVDEISKDSEGGKNLKYFLDEFFDTDFNVDLKVRGKEVVLTFTDGK